MAKADTMRLVNCKSMKLVDFSGKKKPPYAILSHRWRDGEVTFADMETGDPANKAGYSKLQSMAWQARLEGLRYMWVDTCCIDKQNVTELGEAINSMFKWYKEATQCFVYLHDVRDESPRELREFRQSDWFTRGWTLQELLAPPAGRVIFFNTNWKRLGNRETLADDICSATGIAHDALTGRRHVVSFSVAQRMSWAAKRRTTRIEDEAYCLLGLFDISMSLIYGEEQKAFARLQEEILKNDDDHSIFCWSMGWNSFSGLLAPRVSCFGSCTNTTSQQSRSGRSAFAMTNRGLAIELKITPWSADTYLAFLECQRPDPSAENSALIHKVGIFLRRLNEDDQYARVNANGGKGIFLDSERLESQEDRPIRQRKIFVRKSIDWAAEEHNLQDRSYGFHVPRDWLPEESTTFAANTDATYETAFLTPGSWQMVLGVDLCRADRGLKQVLLGFDFDFNPVVLLGDAASTDDEGRPRDSLLWPWGYEDRAHGLWCEIEEGDKVYHNENRNRLWALGGDRLEGLDVILRTSLNGAGLIVTLKRVELPNEVLVWELMIDELDGPFSSTFETDIEQDATL